MLCFVVGGFVCCCFFFRWFVFVFLSFVASKQTAFYSCYNNSFSSPVPSLPSPSATSLKDIIEQERSQASIDVNSATEVRACLHVCFVLYQDREHVPISHTRR